MMPLRELLQRLALWVGFIGVLSATLAGTLGHAGGFVAVQNMTNHLPPMLWECLTVLGDERVLLAIFLPFAMRYPRQLFAILLAAALAGLLARGLKMWAALPRPAAVLPAELITIIGPRVTRHAFPSGHTASLFAFVGVLLGLPAGLRYRYALLLLAALAGLSRVAVGAHWPLDVLAGAMLGLIAAMLALSLQNHCRWEVGPRLQALLLAAVIVSTATLPFDGQGYEASLPLRLAVCLWGLGALAIACRQGAGRRLQTATVIT